MRVVHLNYKERAGGAAAATSRLHGGLQRLGVDSRMVVVRRQSRDDPTVTALTGRLHQAWRLLGGVSRRSRRLLFPRPPRPPFNDDRGPFGRRILELLGGADVVHLHWIAKMLDLQPFLAGLPASLPVVWTLHDFNPFTGGCHYPGTCRRFEASCGACPMLASGDEHDRTYRTWKRKREAYRGVRDRLRVVTPSRSLGGEALRSGLFRESDVICIPNGVDTELFSPGSKQEARLALKVPVERPVVLFVGESLDNPIKGFGSLVDAMNRVERTVPGVTLLTCGAYEGSPTARHVSLGYADGQALVNAYRAADVLAVPSLDHNLPNAVLESLACGTPVVGSAIGGIPDMVRPGSTGALAAAGDPADLAQQIVQLLEDPGMRETMSNRCRDVAVNDYAVDVQARRYAEVYRSLVPE